MHCSERSPTPKKDTKTTELNLDHRLFTMAPYHCIALQQGQLESLSNCRTPPPLQVDNWWRELKSIGQYVLIII